jgi:hypothetical protein
MILRFLLLILCASVAILLPGCATSRQAGPHKTKKDSRWSSPNALYFRAAPHPSLYVEVDVVKGSEPDDKALEELRSFLTTHCDKPSGITVQRSDVISVGAARGYTATALARKYVNGPPKTSGPAPAFLYVLFYNDALSVKSRPKATGKGASLLLIPNREVASPYAEMWPYPSIFFNTGLTLWIEKSGILRHEAGHILGLADRQNRARGGHCANWRCAMQRGRDYVRNFSWLLGPPSRDFCAECRAELRERATNEAPANQSYVGPVLVRSEKGYHVLHLFHAALRSSWATLPGMTAIFFLTPFGLRPQTQITGCPAR